MTHAHLFLAGNSLAQEEHASASIVQRDRLQCARFHRFEDICHLCRDGCRDLCVFKLRGRKTLLRFREVGECLGSFVDQTTGLGEGGEDFYEVDTRNLFLFHRAISILCGCCGGAFLAHNCALLLRPHALESFR